MKNKKGDLLNEVIYLVVAALVLAGIVYGIYQIYMNISSTQEKDARKTLDSLVEKINLLEDGERGVISIQNFKGAQDNWIITGFSSTQENRPDKCFFGSCLCVCPAEFTKMQKERNSFDTSGTGFEVGVMDYLSKICQSEGICKDIESEGILFHEVDTRFTPDLNDVKSYIVLDENEPIIELKVIRTNSLLDIEHHSQNG